MMSAIKQWFRAIKTQCLIRLIVGMIWLTGLTARIKWVGQDIPEELKTRYPNLILALWHNNIYFCTWLLKNRNINALVSQSKDGEGIAQIIERFGFTTTRGSSSRGGASALRQLAKILCGSAAVAITPDGPRGPKCKVQPGIVVLAKLTGLPIIPWHYEAQHAWFAKSWDTHKFPKPFTRVVCGYGSPLYVPQDLPAAEIAAYCLELEEMMQDHALHVEQTLKVWQSS